MTTRCSELSHLGGLSTSPSLPTMLSSFTSRPALLRHVIGHHRCQAHRRTRRVTGPGRGTSIRRRVPVDSGKPARGCTLRFGDKTVVVTGAGGFIGSALVERLGAEGAHVRAMLRYTSRGQRGCLSDIPEAVMREIDITLGDVRDFDAVREVARGADAIFHLAALIGIPYSYEHPQEVIDTNVMGTSNVLLAAKELDTLERIVLTSTSEVYGSALSVPIDEEHPLQAQSPYSATKIAADALGLSFSRSFGMPEIIGHKLDVVVDDQRLRPKKSEVSRLLGDSSKAQQLAGWRAEVSLDEGLRRTSEWIQSHLHEYRTQEYAI